jgi:hypothetical protein
VKAFIKARNTDESEVLRGVEEDAYLKGLKNGTPKKEGR